MVKTLEPRYGQPLFLVGNHYDLAIKFETAAMRSIHGHDITIVNQGHHRTAAHSQAAGMSGIGAPVARRSQHGFGISLVERSSRIALSPVGCNRHGQDRNCRSEEHTSE